MAKLQRRVTVLRKWAVRPSDEYIWRLCGLADARPYFSVTPAGRKALAEAKGAKHGK